MGLTRSIQNVLGGLVYNPNCGDSNPEIIMNIRRLLLLGLIIMPFQGWAQSQSSFKINQLTITDTVLVNSINNLIQKEINNRDTANLFKKGYGYVMVNILAYGEADTLRKYYICPNSGTSKKMILFILILIIIAI